MEDYCLLVSMVVERGLGSWSRQIGFNVCKTKRLLYYKALMYVRTDLCSMAETHNILLCLWISYICYICVSVLFRKNLLKYYRWILYFGVPCRLVSHLQFHIFVLHILY